MSVSDPFQRNVPVGGRQTVASGLLSTSDPLAPKRVCFYKSGDPQFSGVRAVVSGRTFKSFDALLDGLSRKVPLPFGVRTITTPRGSRPVLSLDDLEDGGVYLCSDRRKVRPIDLDAAKKRLVPWNLALQSTRGRRVSQVGVSRARGRSSFEQQTPKMVTVFRNGDPSVCHSMVLQERSSLTFESLLLDISKVMQFPAQKLYTTDGRRVDALEAFLVCSSVVASSGHEPFRPDSYGLKKPPLTSRSAGNLEPGSLLPGPRKSRSLPRKNSSARNFSPSSDTFLANRLKDSMSGSLHKPRSSSTVDTTELACAGDRQGLDVGCAALPPPDFEDIEKSCRINQDGSMTVEMKVRLKVKEEETIHWTTTLSRSDATCWPGGGAAPPQQREGTSPDASDSSAAGSDDNTDRGGIELQPPPALPGAGDPDEEGDDGAAAFVNEEKPRIRRVQTPGPRALRRRQPSCEFAQSESDTEVQESEVSANYSHQEQPVGGAVATKHSSRPVPKPRSMAPANQRELRSAFQASRSAEVFQIQDSGGEVKGSMLCAYKEQSYFGGANITNELDSDTARSNDNSQLYKSPSGSLTGREFDSSSTFSETANPSDRIQNNLSSFTDNAACGSVESLSELSSPDTACSESHSLSPGRKKSSETLKSKQEASVQPLNPDRTLKKKTIVDLRGGKLVKSTSEMVHGEEEDEMEAKQDPEYEPRELRIKKTKGMRDRGDIIKSPTLLFNIKHLSRSAKQLNLSEGKSITETQLNVSTYVRKNVFDIQTPFLVQKMLLRQWSMNEGRLEPEDEGKICESASMPVLRSSSSAVNEYVESWLEKMPPQNAESCAEAAISAESEAKVQFQIGSESSDETEAPKSTPKELSTCEYIADRPSSPASAEGGFQPGPEYERCMDKTAGKSKSQTSLQPLAEAKNLTIHKSAEAPVQSGSEMPLALETSQEPQIKSLLEQLRWTIQSIEQLSQPKVSPPRLERPQSALDFSSQVASIFGSPSEILIAFLCVISVKEAMASGGGDHPSAGQSSASEALQMVKTLHKLASTEDLDELQTGLSYLHRSASSELLQNWKSFQRLRCHSGSQEDLWASEHPTLYGKNVEDCRDKDGYPCGFPELMKELGISGNLKRELSSLVMGNNLNRNEEITAKSEEVHVNSTTKEDYFVESVKGTGVSDLAESVAEDEIADSEQSTAEEIRDLTQSNNEKEINKPEEAILDENDNDSFQEEVNNFKESVLEEDDDFAHSPLGTDKNDNTCSSPENDVTGSCSEVQMSTDHVITGNCSPSVGEGAGPDQCDHEEAGYLEERGDHRGKSIISVLQEKDTNNMQSETCSLQVGRVSQGPPESATRPLKESEVTVDYSVDNVRKAKPYTGSEKCKHPSPTVIAHSVKIPEDLLEYVRLILRASSLMFSCDSRGHLWIEPERPCDRPVKGVPEYRLKRLPSPSLSNISDYRETTASDRLSLSPQSVDLPSDSEAEDSGVQGFVNGLEERKDIRLPPDSVEEGSEVQGFVSGLEGGNDTELPSESEGEGSGVQSFVNGLGERNDTGQREIEKAVEHLTSDFSFDPDERTDETTGLSQGETPEHTTPYVDDDLSDGVLIDKGRWLLRENHLIRKSPPVSSRMYQEVETSSTDSAQDEGIEDIPGCCTQHSPMELLSSSELEELAGPVTPKCSYFNMSHGSDSELFQDEPSEWSGRGVDGDIRHGNGKSAQIRTELVATPLEKHHRTLPKTYGSLPSFASVEFKMADNRVHPHVQPPGVTTVPSQTCGPSNLANETQNEQEEPQLVCGQHCIIL